MKPRLLEFIGELLLAHLSRAAATPGTDPSGVPTGSSPTVAREAAVVAPGGTGPAAVLDAQSEGEVPGTARSGDPDKSGQLRRQERDVAPSTSDPHPRHQWFLDNDVEWVSNRPNTTVVQVKPGVL